VIAFATPLSFLLLALVATIGAGLLWLERWRRRARERFAGPQAARWPAPAGWPQAVLLVAAASLVVFAAARPQWGSRESQVERRGFDLVIVLDISQSMQATDADPSRQGLARDELVRLVDGLRGNRVGLVLFAGTALLRSPLTTDMQAVSELIRRAERETSLTRAGSDLGAALGQAARILEASESPGKAVLVVSDGEDHIGSFGEAAGALAAEGVLIFSAGAGTAAGSTLTEQDPLTGTETLKLDADGSPVITRLDESTLRAVADAGGGHYTPLGADARLIGLRDDLARLEQTPLGEEIQRLPVERFQPFLAAALALLALTWLLPQRLALRLPRVGGKARPALALLALALIGGACGGSDSLRRDNEAANRQFETGEFEAALASYQRLLALRPDVDELSFNAGNTLHRLGRFDRAVAETRRALPPATAALGAATYFNLGNHLFALEELGQAYDAYRSALLLDPDDEDAKNNLELALRLLQAMEPPPLDGPPGGEGDALPPPGDEAEPAPGGEPTGGEPTGGEPTEDAPPGSGAGAAARRSLAEALSGIDENLTFEEAVEVLDLLRQQQETSRRSGGAAANGPDY